MWKIVLSHTWFKCQCILMIPSLSFCNKHQYWNWLRHEDWLSKAGLIWLFWKGGLGTFESWKWEQSTFNHNTSLSLSTIWGEEAEYIEEEGEERCERLFCLIRDLNMNAFWWYHHYHFATSINTGTDWDMKRDFIRQIDMIIVKGRSSSILIYLNHRNENTINFQSKYLSITLNNMRKRRWIYRRRWWRQMMWKIVLSHTWFKCQCILMIPWLSFCNKHQYWDWLRCEVWLIKTVLRWLFWKGGHLVSSWYIWITEMRTQSTFNHNTSISLSTIWVE